MKLAAIIAAAGLGRRFSPGAEKLFVKVGGKPLLYFTLRVLQRAGCVSSVVLVVNPRHLKRIERMVITHRFTKVIAVIKGGRTRFESVKRGLQCLPADTEYVAVHDGARPLVTRKVIERVFHAARQSGAAIAAVPVKSTIKDANANGTVRSTPLRSRLWEAQTPQIFRKGAILEAYRQCVSGDDVTDDSMLVERLGVRVKLVKGDYSNIKITTKDDLATAKTWLKDV